MIYTLTSNPNLDYYCTLGKPLCVGAINRTSGEAVSPGGKGVNVSLLLEQLGVPSCILGFLAGQTGRMLEAMLARQQCRWLWLQDGMTRINVKLTGDVETAVNGAGPALDEDAVNRLCRELSLLQPGDILVVSGNLQKAPDGAFSRILSAAKTAGAELVVDTTAGALRDSFRFSPLFIKPNEDELCELFGKTEASEDELIDMARSLQRQGVRSVLVSRGKNGALLLSEDGAVYRASLEEAPFAVISTVGAGDSVTAGFLAGLCRGDPVAEAFRLGAACGSATAFSPCLADESMIRRVLSLISITKL